jgi:hypothetical protein
VTDLYDPREQWASFLINALKAKELQAKNVNYIVRGEDIVIVDEFTGRTMPGRRWSDGLHQARARRAPGAPARGGAPRLCAALGRTVMSASLGCRETQRIRELRAVEETLHVCSC